MIAVGLLLLALSGQPDPGNTAPAPNAAQAQIQATTPAQAPAPTSDDQKQICKYVPVTGSRFGSTECKSKADWAAEAAAARDLVNKATTGACIGAHCH